jgi:acylglycerol lipase
MAAKTPVATGAPVQATPLETWDSFDGTPLSVRHWIPAGKPWASVLIVHGIGEHGGRYERTGRLMAEAGLDVYAYDLRGHGLSGGRRVYVDRFDDYVKDLESAIDHLPDHGLPVVVMGHSMGALIVLSYVCSGRKLPGPMILSAAPLAARVPRWQLIAAPVLSRLAPRIVIANPISGDQLSRDPEVGKAYFADPLVQPRSTARLGAELFKAMKAGRGQIGAIKVPTLAIHGGDDRLVPTETSEALGHVPGVERRVLPGLRHETLNEPEGPEVVASIVEWLRGQVGPKSN